MPMVLKLDVVGARAPRIERGLHLGVGALAIVGVEAGQEQVVIDRGVGRQAEERLAARVPGELSIEQSEIPGADGAARQGEPQPLFGDLQLRVGRLDLPAGEQLVSDLEPGAHDADHLP